MEKPKTVFRAKNIKATKVVLSDNILYYFHEKVINKKEIEKALQEDFSKEISDIYTERNAS